MMPAHPVFPNSPVHFLRSILKILIKRYLKGEEIIVNKVKIAKMQINTHNTAQYNNQVKDQPQVYKVLTQKQLQEITVKTIWALIWPSHLSKEVLLAAKKR